MVKKSKSQHGGRRVGAGRKPHPLPDRFQLRHTPEQKEAWQAAADRDQRELTSWIRLQLDRAAASQP